MRAEQSQALCRWFAENRENHFFRQNRTPYRVWISEVALQQTRIQAALAPLQRFLNRFATIEELAKSSEDEVVQAFAGLGYYNRARNLRKGAIYIVETLGGSFPTGYDELLKVPSIGPYTAAAVASICFDQRVPVIDGNVKRVVSRLLAIDERIDTNGFDRKIEPYLQQMMAASEQPAGLINEAIMELGQKICLKSKPTCSICPLQAGCKALELDQVSKYPQKKPRPIPQSIIYNLYLPLRNDKLGLQKVEEFYFLKGHFVFPGVLVFADGRREKSYDCEIEPGPLLATFKHTITNHKLEIRVFSGQSSPDCRQLQFVTADEAEEKLASSLMRKALMAWLNQRKNPTLLL